MTISLTGVEFVQTLDALAAYKRQLQADYGTKGNAHIYTVEKLITKLELKALAKVD